MINLQNSEEFHIKRGINNTKNITNKNKRNKITQESASIPKINLTYSGKNLIIQIKSYDEEFERILKITPWGIEGSSKMVNYEEGCETFFGSDDYSNDVRL